jgi:hypothetical protein
MTKRYGSALTHRLDDPGCVQARDEGENGHQDLPQGLTDVKREVLLKHGIGW